MPKALTLSILTLLALGACASEPAGRRPAGTGSPITAAAKGSGEFVISGAGLAPLSLRFLSARSFHLGPETPDPVLAKVPELMIVKPDSGFPSIEARLTREADGLRFTTSSGLAVLLRPDTAGGGYSATVTAEGKPLLQDWKVQPSSHGMSLALRKGEHVYGFGDKRLAIDQRGHEVKLWNADAFASETNTSYKNVPFYSSSAGYGLFLHNFHVMTFDVGAAAHDRLKVAAEGGDMDFYVFLGAPKEILTQYTEITGRPAMMPRWFFGYHQGRAAPGFRADQGITVARTMREKKLPIDVIYYDDWDHDAINRDFVSNLRDQYHVRLSLGYGMPLVGDYVGVNHDEKPLLAELQRRNFLWVDAAHKAIIGPAEEVASEQPNAPNSVSYVDFFSPEAVEYMFDQKFSEPLKAGAALGMADFGELANVEKPRECFWPSNGLDTEVTHNLYGLAYSSALVEGSRKRAGGRSLGMVRPGTAGTQRLGWTTTGDSTPDYKNFRFHFKGAMNLSLSGFSNVGYDIGGWNAHGADDVYARWFAAGTFNPLMWSHGIGDHEPYSHGPAVEQVAREFLGLRYRLIPHLYTQMELASSTGIPILRPFALQEPDDPKSAAIEDEEFVGDDLLVAPLFNKEGNRDVYLPKGTWYDLFDETAPLAGGRSVTRRNVPLNRIPAYVRAGAILPMGPPMQYTGEKAVDPLDVNYYAFPAAALQEGARKTKYSLYEDDGESTGYAQGAYQFTVLHAEQNLEGLNFRIRVKHSGTFSASPARSYVLRLHGLAVPGTITVNGRPAVRLEPGKSPESGQAAWRPGSGNKPLLLYVPGASPGGPDSPLDIVLR